MSLAEQLQEVGLKFVEEHGYLRGGFAVEGDRTQNFILDPDSDDFYGHSEYDFMSVVGSAEDASKVKQACEWAACKKRGGVVVKEGHILLKFEVPAGLDSIHLAAQVQAVCAMADEMEQELFTVDAF